MSAKCQCSGIGHRFPGKDVLEGDITKSDFALDLAQLTPAKTPTHLRHPPTSSRSPVEARPVPRLLARGRILSGGTQGDIAAHRGFLRPAHLIPATFPRHAPAFSEGVRGMLVFNPSQEQTAKYCA